MSYTGANLYRDFMCTQIGQNVAPGQGAAFGHAASLENWSAYNYQAPEPGTIYSVTGKMLAVGIGEDRGRLVLSGGAALYDNRIYQTMPTGENIEADRISNLSGSQDLIYNPLFTGKEENYAYCLSISCDANGYDYRIHTCLYTQDPQEGQRTTWNYLLGEYNWHFDVTVHFKDVLEDFPLIKIYKITVQEQNFFLLAIGVSEDGKYSVGSATTTGSFFILIPEAYFKDKTITPYVGPVSKESVEASFMPTEERHDEILSRSNYDENPYGVNSGSGIKLIFPNVLQDQSVYSGNMQQIINGIYRGSATGFINMATQYIAQQVGGNSARAASEVNVILNGILSAHSLPLIYPAGSSTTYATNATQFQTICGYDVLLNQIDVTSPGQKTIFEYTYTPPRIEPCLNCFLDFEPYTQITLKLPFFPSISLPPSLIYGNNLKVTYKIDVLTGILSADVSVIYFGREFIISTVQQNVKTSIPIMGAGAQDGALQKISSSAISLISSFGASSYQSGDEMQTGLSFNAGAAAGAILTGADAISKAGTAVPVGKMSVDGLGVYLSPRSAYLIITHPEAAIPAREEDGVITGSFLDTFGMAANLGGIVSDFAGGFASFSSVDLAGFDATEEEKAAIRSALLEGVYV